MQGDQRKSAMGATTEGIHSPIRLLNTHQRVTPVATTDMTRCETQLMLPHHAKSCVDLTAQTTNTPTLRVMAGRNRSTHTESERGMEGPAFPLRRIPTTTAFCTAPTPIPTPTGRLTHPMNLQMIGQSTLVPLGRSTTTTAGRRCHSGRNPRSGLKESRGRRRLPKQR